MQLQKTSQEVREEYVQHLLGSIPKDTNGTFQIVEKSAVVPPIAPSSSQAGVYDTIEGYKIEIKKNGKAPTTMILKKKKEEEIKKEEELKQQQQQHVDDIDPEDPDALFETMMMLKDMKMDKEDKPRALEPQATLAQKVSPKPALSQTMTPPKPVIELSKQEKKPEQQDTNVIKVTTPAAQKQKKSMKKKKKVPELSLFGTVWTMLDHMTTKATRIYLNELQNNHQRIDVGHLIASENDLMDEAIYLRGQIFSERILDT